MTDTHTNIHIVADFRQTIQQQTNKKRSSGMNLGHKPDQNGHVSPLYLSSLVHEKKKDNAATTKKK